MAQSPSIDDLRIDRGAEQEAPSRLGRWIAILLLAAATVAVAWWWLGRGRTAAVTVAPVRELEAGSRPEGSVLDASGYVVARREATVSSKVTGKIVEVLVEEGMRVEEGQVLARLDDQTVRRQLALAEAELETARRAVKETGVLLAEAQLNLRRADSLATAGVSSEADRDTAQARVDSLEAQRAVAGQQVEVAQRRRDVWLQELDDTVIRAPFSGVAISKDAQPGEMISPVSAGGGFTRTGISTVVDMSSLEIEVDVNEAYIGRVQPGQRVTATLDAYPDWKIPARVITIVPAADRQKATVRVRIGFEQLDPRILPDMGVKVAFLEEAPAQGAEETRPSVRMVPREALRRDGEQDVVFVVTGETVERRAVTIGSGRGEEVEIKAGLRGGEQVVVTGPEDLADGDRVRVVSPE